MCRPVGLGRGRLIHRRNIRRGHDRGNSKAAPLLCHRLRLVAYRRGRAPGRPAFLALRCCARGPSLAGSGTHHPIDQPRDPARRLPGRGHCPLGGCVSCIIIVRRRLRQWYSRFAELLLRRERAPCGRSGPAGCVSLFRLPPPQLCSQLRERQWRRVVVHRPRVDVEVVAERGRPVGVTAMTASVASRVWWWWWCHP